MTTKNDGPGILLDAGTNELEVLVFRLGELYCGVNVAKVREVIGDYRYTFVPRAHPSVVGVLNLRSEVFPLVDLQRYFNTTPAPEGTRRNVIVTEFNDTKMGFIVDAVERIYRLSWNAVMPLPEKLSSMNTAATAMCHIDNNRIAVMVDFEKVAFDIQGIHIAPERVGTAVEGVDRGTMRLLLAEDSQTMRRFMHDTLQQAGYCQVTLASDGAEAWETIEATVEGSQPPFDAIISDIEMPRMDGLHLCKRIKQNPKLRDTPVIVFSSLVSDDNQKKLAQVNADASLTKPQLRQLVTLLDRLLAGRVAEAAC